MKKILLILLTLILSTPDLIAHTSHYQNFQKIEMEILKDGEVIGYNYYFFDKKDNVTIIKNQIKFKVSCDNLFANNDRKPFAGGSCF